MDILNIILQNTKDIRKLRKEILCCSGGGSGTGTVTSVALSMPSAFNVASSPVTTSGTIAVTGSGTTAQYIRGDGTLATLPVYTANNGITNNANTFQLGGILVQDTSIVNAGFRLYATNNTVIPTIQGNNTSTGNGLEGNNTGSGNGVLGTALSGVGGAFSSNSSFGVTAQSNTNTALICSGTLGAQLTAFNTTTLNNSIPLLRVVRSTGASVPSDNVGGSIDFHTYSSNLTDRLSNSLISRWVVANDATRTSQFEMWGINNTNFIKLVTFSSTNNGRVGIGIDPLATLHINGDTRLVDTMDFRKRAAPGYDIMGYHGLNDAHFVNEFFPGSATKDTLFGFWSNTSSSGVGNGEAFYITKKNGGVIEFTNHKENAGSYRDMVFSLNGFNSENARLQAVTGNFGVGVASPTSKIDVDGANGYSQLRLRDTYTPTSTADANGNTGDIAWDDSFVYVKTSAGWKRSALSTF